MFETKYHLEDLGKYNFLVTGGAGFIGSNLAEYLLIYGAKKVRVLDNLSTGLYSNIQAFEKNNTFEFINGDIRNLSVCNSAVNNIDIVFHQAALGSVPRSISDPVTTNDVNISGSLNMLVASRDANVKRFIYAASSSTYGDSVEMPKFEERIGKPLSPYAITKYINELYADVFSRIYGIEAIGLRYFNVFGRNQSPEGAYAAVIPKFVIQLINHISPVIFGDGEHSRDFTYIENVIQANMLAAFTQNPQAINTVYNVAFGQKNTLNQLTNHLKEILSEYDQSINDIEIKHGPDRAGDIPHSLASIQKSRLLLGYKPLYDLKSGLKEAVKWYWENLKIYK
jgi:UDP-N-acetylglucosamine 4-epimerase